jgi:hypothetical protein
VGVLVSNNVPGKYWVYTTSTAEVTSGMWGGSMIISEMENWEVGMEYFNALSQYSPERIAENNETP